MINSISNVLQSPICQGAPIPVTHINANGYRLGTVKKEIRREEFQVQNPKRGPEKVNKLEKKTNKTLYIVIFQNTETSTDNYKLGSD